MAKKKYKNVKRQRLMPEEKAIQAAMAQDIIAYFVDTYETAESTRLANYQRLCRDLKVEVGIDSLTCKIVSG